MTKVERVVVSQPTVKKIKLIPHQVAYFGQLFAFDKIPVPLERVFGMAQETYRRLARENQERHMELQRELKLAEKAAREYAS